MGSFEFLTVQLHKNEVWAAKCVTSSCWFSNRSWLYSRCWRSTEKDVNWQQEQFPLQCSPRASNTVSCRNMSLFFIFYFFYLLFFCQCMVLLSFIQENGDRFRSKDWHEDNGKSKVKIKAFCPMQYMHNAFIIGNQQEIGFQSKRVEDIQRLGHSP